MIIHPTCMENHCCKEGFAGGVYVLPPLPCELSEYEPVLDAETVRLHHDCHHAAYVAGANSAMAELRRIAAGKEDANAAPCATRKLAFNLGGHLLHCLYWNCICSDSKPLSDSALVAAIAEQFGDFDGFVRLFKSAAIGVQGSGWAILAVEQMSRRLMVLAVHRHQDALVGGMMPILACDVWEHAYYLRYQNNRAAYVDSFMRHINWEWVAHRFNNICQN